MPRKDRNRLRGELLIKHIEYVSGSSNLLDYEGNIRNIAADCGYLELYQLGGKGSKGGLLRFFQAYYEALKELNLYQNDIHSNYENLKKELHKKYEPVPEKKKKKLRRKDFINEKNQFQENINENQLKDFRPKQYETLSEFPFLKQVLALHSMGKTETSICIITGYEVDKIGQFRRAFAKAASVQLAPLSRMIKEMKNKEKLEVEKYKSTKKLKLTELTDNAIFLHDIEGKSEASICESCGYKVENINTFRKDFAEIIGCKLAPLKIMISELRNDPDLLEFWGFMYSTENVLKHSQELISNQSEELIETEQLFVDREKITSQVKRAYRNPKFRKKVLEKYGSNCCCCDIAIETLIEAAHIVPVENKGNDDASNGIPLCPTHHTAFDNFLFTINPTDNLIIYKEGLSSEDLQITKTECKLNVSKESLEYRYKLFNQ